MPIDEINDVLTDKEKRKGIMAGTLAKAAKSRDTSAYTVSPNMPLAAQVIQDKVIDMLLFLTFRFMKHFDAYKQKRLAQLELYAATLAAIEDQNKQQSMTRSQSARSKSVHFGEASVLGGSIGDTSQ